jgi:hypothetical protein
MLPTQLTTPAPDLGRATILLYGQPKIGKSTIASQFPAAIFLATEPGLNALSTYQVDISNWQQLLDAAKELAAGKHQFKTCVIDTIDNAFKFCSEHILAANNIKHESDLGFGKGWKLVENEFFRVLTRLAQLPYGLVLISHSKSIEVDTSVGKYTKTVPTLPDKARAIALGLSDIILYADIDTGRTTDGKPVEARCLRTSPTRYYEAGDRFNRLPETIELNYTALKSAFEKGIK